MRAQLHQRFKKRYRKLRVAERNRVKERLGLFVRDPFDPILNNHPLRGKYQGCRSTNIGGNLRAIYKEIAVNTVFFVELGVHGELYS